MAINYNGTNITNIVFNGVTLSKVIMNGVTVFLSASALAAPSITRGVTGQTSVAWTVTNNSTETVTVFSRVNGFSWQNKTNIASGATTTSFTQGGLSAGTNYTINAYVEVTGLQTSPTTDLNFTTAQPVYPALPSIINVTQTPAQITWQVRNNDGGTATTVHSYHKTPTNVYTWFYDYTVPSGGTSDTFVKSTSPGLSYTLGARVSVDGKTDQESYTTYTNTTPTISTPSVNATRLSSSSMRVTWTASNYAAYYLVSYRIVGGSWSSEVTRTGLTTDFTGLIVEDYEVRVRAYYSGYYSNYGYDTVSL